VREIKISRVRFAACLAGAVLGGAVTTGCASAYQGHMENAVGDLNGALNELSQATGNKGGHREVAMNLIQQAIGEVNAGIAFADGQGPPVNNYNGPPP
jgi:hypothetical protein